MLVEDQVAAVHTLYRAYETRGFESASALFTPDAEIINVATGDEFRGRDGYVQFARGWPSAFPDLETRVLRIDTSNHTGVAEYAFRGTHTGAIVSASGFVPPTWASIEFRLCDVLTFRDNEIARLHCYFDSATMLRQMGLLPNSPLHSTDRRAPLELYATQVDSSAEQRNKAMVHRFLEEVVNQKNPAAAIGICVQNLSWHAGAMGEAHDVASFQSQLARLYASFPDLNIEVEDVTAEQDRVAVRVIMRGTHLGDFQGVPPTGKKIASPGMNSYRMADNRIVEGWWQHDILSVLRQLDAVPAPVE